MPGERIVLKRIKQCLVGTQLNLWLLQESTGLRLLLRGWALRINLHLGMSNGVSIWAAFLHVVKLASSLIRYHPILLANQRKVDRWRVDVKIEEIYEYVGISAASVTLSSTVRL
jgi:hypothetical protein